MWVCDSGGAGVVTLARDLETGEHVALKRLRRQSNSLLRSFRREADTIAALSGPGTRVLWASPDWRMSDWDAGSASAFRDRCPPRGLPRHSAATSGRPTGTYRN